MTILPAIISFTVFCFGRRDDVIPPLLLACAISISFPSLSFGFSTFDHGKIGNLVRWQDLHVMSLVLMRPGLHNHTFEGVGGY